MTAKKEATEKKPATTTFGEIAHGTWFVLLGDYLQRGMSYDKPKRPMRYVKISDRRYINALSLINGKLPPKNRLKQIAHSLSSNHAVIICSRGF